jgi:hypothetical protein
LAPPYPSHDGTKTMKQVDPPSRRGRLGCAASRMEPAMHRYNQKVGLIGLLLGVAILAIGFATQHARLAGSPARWPWPPS